MQEKSSVAKSSFILDQILTDYFLRLDDGEQVDPERIIQDHPEIAEKLRAFFATHAETATRMRELAKCDLLQSETTAPMESLPQFSSFRLLNGIKRGGMGDVYLAEQVQLGRQVAVKLMRQDRVDDEVLVRRFQLEARTAGQLDHPGIVAVHDAGSEHGFHYLVMEYVPGVDLAELLREGPLEPGDAARIISQVASAVHAAHDCGVLHRDLKPANIIIDSRTGCPKVADFGLAKSGEDSAGITKTGNLLGTPDYMSPEQTGASMESISARTDVYGLGATLYHLITGRPPFEGVSVVDTFRQIATVDPVRPTLINESVPQDLETISLRALEKEPNRRFLTARLLGEELDRFVRGEQILARPATVFQQLRRTVSRNRLAASLIATIVGVLLTSLIAIFGLYARSTRAAAESQKLAIGNRRVVDFFASCFHRANPANDDVSSSTTALEVLELALSEIESNQTLKDDPLVTATLAEALGTSLTGLGAHKRAIVAHKISSRLRTQLLGQDHRQTLESSHNLAVAYYNDHQFGLSREIHKEVLE